MDASDNIYVLNYYELNYASSPAITVYGPLANNATGFLDTAPLCVLRAAFTNLDDLDLTQPKCPPDR